MIKIIAAVSTNGVIGIDNKIPWAGKYPDDMKFFRTMTKDSIVVMGRKTYQSLNCIKLAGRDNRVISSRDDIMNGKASKSIRLQTDQNNQDKPITIMADTYRSINDAITRNIATKNIWLIGGEGIYSEGLQYADEICLTLIPERVETAGRAVVRFPFIHPLEWRCELRTISDLVPELKEQKLMVAVYKRK